MVQKLTGHEEFVMLNIKIAYHISVSIALYSKDSRVSVFLLAKIQVNLTKNAAVLPDK